MFLRSTCVLLCLTFGSSSFAEDTFDLLVGRHTYELKLDDGRLSGAGANWLRERAAEAHFFMIGEQHATADIALLSTALYRDLNRLGYRYAAVESGPWSTPIVEQLLGADDPRAFEDYLAASDAGVLTFPFFFFAEEAGFARAVIESSWHS